MTICVGALCDDGKACIVAADRQMTAAAMSLEFEHASSKIEGLCGCQAMSAGDALLAAELVKRTRDSLGSASHGVLQVAEQLRNIYMAVHLERAEHVILHPRGYTLREFKERGAQQLPPQVYLNVDNQLWNFGVGAVEFLLAGPDDNGMHIFRVHYSGMAGGDWMEWCDRLGYRAIGSGALHASISLAMVDQHPRLSVAETLYNIYGAKRNSEVAPGVGRATDVVIMTTTKAELVGQERLEKLAASWEKNRQNKPSRKELEAL